MQHSSPITNISLNIFKLNGMFLEWGNKFSEQHGLTSARWQVLGAIYLAQQPLTIPQISEAMGISRQGVLKQINLLEKEALVVSKANPNHKKSPLYALTEQGEVIYQAVEKRWNKFAKELAKHFSEEELAITQDVLSKLLQPHFYEHSVK